MFIHEGFHRQDHFQQIPVTVCLNGEECPSEMPCQARAMESAATPVFPLTLGLTAGEARWMGESGVERGFAGGDDHP